MANSQQRPSEEYVQWIGTRCERCPNSISLFERISHDLYDDLREPIGELVKPAGYIVAIACVEKIKEIFLGNHVPLILKILILILEIGTVLSALKKLFVGADYFFKLLEPIFSKLKKPNNINDTIKNQK
jgi:hypothetical protein